MFSSGGMGLGFIVSCKIVHAESVMVCEYGTWKLPVILTACQRKCIDVFVIEKKLRKIHNIATFQLLLHSKHILACYSCTL